MGNGVTGIETRIDLAIGIAQTITIELDATTEAGFETWRQHQVEIPDQAIRCLRLQVQMQGVTPAEATRLGQVLFWQQPAQLHLWQIATVLR